MSRQQQLRETYANDVDRMATKSRFGFFSISPSCRAGITDFSQKKARKSSDGKVIIGEKNILGGAFKSGKLNRQLFSYTSSIFNGDPYKQPLKNIRSSSLAQVSDDKGIFKPAKLNKTLATPSYNYMPESTKNEDPKRNREPNGRVKTLSRNVCTNLDSKLEHERTKSFKYSADSYDNSKFQRQKELHQNISKRGEAPLKLGNLGSGFFSSSKETYHDINKHEKSHTTKEIGQQNAVQHQKSFVPSCRENFGKQGLFSNTVHMAEGKQLKKMSIKAMKGDKDQPFKLSKKAYNSKPCPSVSCCKMNLYRMMR